MLFAASALEHVLDTFHWHIFEELDWHLDLWHYGDYGISKYSILMLLAALLIMAIYIPLARKIQTGAAPTGSFWNLFEALLTFIRDQVAKPYIGKDADQYVPYLWTIFLFVLFCNLFGMIPFLGSPTASFTVTAVLAVSVFLFIHVNSLIKFGLKSHLLSFAPDLDMPYAMKLVIIPMIWAIEFGGLLLKCFVLAIRLFANMFAGHIVLGTILLFIPMARTASEGLFWTVSVSSVLGVIALSFLELFVAFLQAFIFVFLTALFFGGVLEHAEHASHADAHGSPTDALAGSHQAGPGPDDAHAKAGVAVHH